MVMGSAAYEGIASLLGEATVQSREHWYAACTRPRHEKHVAKQLRDRGIEFFLPLYRSVRRWKDRRKEVDLVLFPGYIFVHTSADGRLRVLQLPGVTHFVFFGGSPAALPGDDIEALQRGFAYDIRPECHPFLTAGRKVKVVSGPLSGARGILLRRKKNDCRLVISLDAIMRSVSVEIDEADVVPVF
jgi:transcription antitermination factor NusG